MKRKASEKWSQGFYRIETRNSMSQIIIYILTKHTRNEIISPKKYKKIKNLPKENEVFPFID